MGRRTLTSFGLAVKRRLLERGMTQKQLAEKLGISETRVSEALYGAVSGKKHKELIATELGIKLPTKTRRQ
jgi:transcriptional regulator with XRE-family HTH domain